jgi:hypothetical protein
VERSPLLLLFLPGGIFVHRVSNGVIVRDLPVKRVRKGDWTRVEAVVMQCRFEGLVLRRPVRWQVQLVPSSGQPLV